MEKVNSKKQLIIKLAGAALVVCLFLLNARYHVNLNSSDGDLTLSGLRAQAQSGEPPLLNFSPVGNMTRNTLYCANGTCYGYFLLTVSCVPGGGSCSPSQTRTNTSWTDPNYHP
jgi:hypothetical protein